MRNKTFLDYRVVKSHFAEEPDAGGSLPYLRINGGTEPVLIRIPPLVMRRLFRLGQAFNLKQLRYLEPGVKLVIGSVDVPALAKDLQRLKALVNESETHKYADAVLAALAAEPGANEKFVAVFTGA